MKSSLTRENLTEHNSNSYKGFLLFASVIMTLLFLSFGKGAFGQTTYTSVSGATWTSVVWSPAGTPGPGDEAIIAHGNVAVNTAGALEIGSLTVNSGRVLTIHAQNFTVTGTTQVNGTLADNNNGGTNIFGSLVTINAGGTLSTANSSPYTFNGGILNNGTLNMSGTGEVTYGNNVENNGTFNKTGAGRNVFSNNLSLSGTNVLTLRGGLLLLEDVTVNNLGNVNAASTAANRELNGSNSGSTWVNNVNSTLSYSHPNAPMIAGQFNAAASGNTVNYNRNNTQTIRESVYHNLLITNGGTKTLPTVVVRGNFTRQSTINLPAGHNIKFESNSPATYTFNNNQTFQSFIVDKSGSTLTFAPSGSLTTTIANLTIATGSMVFGATNTTVTVTEDLSGAGDLDMTGGTAHLLNLRGASNSIGSLTTAAAAGSSVIVYAGTQDQTMFASPNYRTLRVGGSGNKSLSGLTVVNGILRFNANVFLTLGASDLRLSPASTIETSAAFSNSRMIVTNDLGHFIKEGTTLAHFTTNLPSGVIPVGSNGYYTPMTISSLAATITGTARIFVRAVPTRQPNVPYFNNALIKYWDVETTGLSGITANVNFRFNAANEVIGVPGLYVPRVWNGTDLVAVTGPSAPGANPFSTTGTNVLAGQWTALDPTNRTILYSYQSGDWGNADTWTIDPSGSTLVSPIIPSTGDQVVILNGRTVTTSVARTIGSLDIENGGVLDIGTTTGHNFGPVNGAGRLRLSSITFPAGTFTNFVAATGGTVEYYNLPSGPVVMPASPITYNNLLFTNSTAAAYTVNMNRNFTLNGNLNISRTGSQGITLNIGDAAGNRTITIFGDVTVGADCRFGVSSTYNGSHALNLHKNLTVNGTFDMTNGAAYSASSGRAQLTFLGATTNNTATFNAGSTSELFTFRVNKNDGFELAVNASPSASVDFWGAPYTIEPIRGTLRLGANINITQLANSAGENYNLGAPGILPVLWIDGATVGPNIGQAIVPYGTVRITAGTLDVLQGQGGIVLRESGFLQVDGGVINMRTFRTSTTSVTHRGSFLQTGGTINLLGNGNLNNAYAVFTLPYPENVFRMTGGTINITRLTGGSIATNAGILIASNPQSFEVTGGTLNISTTGNQFFDITSTAPFFDVNISRASAGSGQVRLNSMDWSFDGSNGNRATVQGQPFRVLNNFNLLSTNSPTFNTNDFDVIVNGNMTIASGANYISGNNTLRFQNSNPQSFTINGNLSFFGTGTNLTNGPEDLIGGANYSFSGLTSASNVEAAPNSSMTAERLMEQTNNGEHRFFTPFIPTAGSVTSSIFVKPNGRTCVSLQVGANSLRAIAFYNLTGSGTVTSTNGNVIASSISSEPNGWYRISITSAGHPEYRFRLNLSNNCSATSYAGSTSQGVFAWGLFIENGDVLSDYSPASNSGLNSLAVTKATGATLTIDGGAATVNLNGSLSVNSGFLNIGGKTVNVRGNVINNTEILATSTGRLRLTGLNPQNIGGNGNGIFQHLVLGNTGGSAGAVQYTSTANFRIQSSLEFTTGRVLNIFNRRITFAPAATLISTSGTFGNARFIRTNGFLSDGGIHKEYNSANPSFTYAFGTGTVYTPATISFATNPSTYGTMDVRPVSVKHLYVTDPDAMDYYWKVNQTGFSGIAANSINAVFTYGDVPVNPTITSYIPGYYNFADIAYTTVPDVNAVNETNKTITFNNVSKLEGDYTAGIPAAFGTVIPFYSRANGQWNVLTTWSTSIALKHAGPAATSLPTASSPVIIGDENTYNHTVVVTENNTLSGSLIVDFGSVLDLKATTGNNFGALPFSTAGGAGRIRISSVAPLAVFPGGDFGLFFTPQGGTTEYYTEVNNFKVPHISGAPTFQEIQTYKNLVFNPSTGTNIEFPDNNFEVYENMTIAGSAGGIATMNSTGGRSIRVIGNVNVTSGVFRLPSDFNQILNVDGNLTIGTFGTMDVVNAGSAVHDIQLLGNLTNNGSLNFNQASKVCVSFIGTQSRSITGTNVTASTALGPIVVNKGNNENLLVNLDVAGTVTAPTNNWLSLLNGTFRVSKSGVSLTLTDQPATSFIIPSTAALSINNATATINVAMANSNDAELIVAGKLEILNGTLNVGNAANNTHNDIEYSGAETPQIIVQGNGSLFVNGQIRRNVNVTLGSLSYAQRGNSTVLVRGKNPDPASSFNLNRAKFEILNAGSSFTMEDNSQLTIDRGGLPSGTFGDLFLNPAVSNVTGGNITIGTMNTNAAQSVFRVNSTIPLWDFTIDGMTTVKTVDLVGNPFRVLDDLTINGSSVFLANGLDVNIGGDLINQNPSGTPGINFGGYRTGSINQTTTFDGAAGNQNLQGAASNLTNFANLVLNNSFAGGATNLLANTEIRVSGNFQLLNGNLNGNNNILTIIGNATNNRTITNTGSGFIVMGGSALQNIHGNGSGIFGNLRINNAAGVNLVNPTSINGVLNMNAGLFYINNNQLTLGVASTVTGTLNASSMIRLNGVSSDGGVRKLYPASASDFTFPIGVTLKYTPARINVTNNSVAGEVIIKPVNVKHPATTDPDPKELNYYWNTTATGFSGTTTVTHEYNYLQNDVNGNEAAYKPGRYFSNVWTPTFGINAPSSVNAASDRIIVSGVNYFNGDFTAGEQEEFANLLVYYSRNATNGGNWSDVNSWSTDDVLQHNGAPAVTPPAFNSIVIAAGHTIVVDGPNLGASTSIINGTLNVGNFVGHNFGTVTGTGRLIMAPTPAFQYIFPGGNYTAFVAAGGGTVEYTGGFQALLPSQGIYNNLEFTGPSNKNLFNTDITINGNLTIAAGSVTNLSDRIVSLRGDLTNLVGIPGFVSNNGIVNLNGANQILSGSSVFSNLTVNGGGVKTLGSSFTITNSLVLTNGVVATGANLLTIQSSGVVSGGSSTSYVNGNLQKFIGAATASKLFEVGDAVRYAPANITFAGTTNSSGNFTVSTTSGDHPLVGGSGLDDAKSVNRFWTIQNSAVSGFTSANITFNFNAADVDVATNTSNFLTRRYNGTIWLPATVGVKTSTSTQVTGLGLADFGDFILAEEFSSLLVWTGANSTDWNNVGNWSPNQIPTGSDDITIPNTINQPSFTTPGNGICRNISLLTGATLNIPNGYTITVNGNWNSVNNNVTGRGTVNFTSPTATHFGTTRFAGVVNVANGAALNTNNTLTLTSGASLMHGVGTPGAGGSVSGNVIVQRLGSNEQTRFNYWSSPILNGSVNSLGGNRYFYNPNGATGSDVEGLRDGWVAAAGAMTNGRGYIATGTPSGLVSFTGTANNGPISSQNLQQGTFTSFNLVGNPYPSAVNATSLVSANPQIVGGAIYLWDDDGSAGTGYDAANDYLVWNGIGSTGPNSPTFFNGFIASCQGFLVQTSNTNPIQFNNAMRATQNNAFFDANMLDRLWISVNTQSGVYNETLIAFKADATEGADQSYDAPKVQGNQHISLYTTINDNGYAIQALPLLTSDRVIQLGLDADANGSQVINIKHIDNLDETAQIILEDTKLSTFHNLRTSGQYAYVYDKNTDSRRFRLHFKPAVVMNASTESCVANDGAITIHSPSTTEWNYTVSNVQGTVVAQGSNFIGTTTVNGLSGGIYTVNLQNQFGSINKAVEIASGSSVTASISSSAQQVDVNDGVVQFEAISEGATDITWDFGDGTIVSGVLNPSHMYTLPGTYPVTFIASNANCMNVQTLFVNVTGSALGINSADKLAFSLFPNPVKDMTTIRLNLPSREDEITINLVDAAGRVVRTEVHKNAERTSQIQLNVNDLATGVYQVLLHGKAFSTSARMTISR